MVIATLFKHGVLIVRVEGDMDMLAADEFRQTVDDAISTSGSKHVLLNLKGVNFIDSSGLGVILGRYKRALAAGGKIMLTNLSPQVFRIFEISGFLKIMQTYKSETEALNSL